jgi:cell division protein FtsB
MDTRQTLVDRSREVATLRGGRRQLEREVIDSTSDAALVRAARQLGLVQPGERLFIVKGIGAWKDAHTIRRHAR